jgi:hypothetical protein
MPRRDKRYGRWWQVWRPVEYGAEAGKRAGSILGILLGALVMLPAFCLWLDTQIHPWR